MESEESEQQTIEESSESDVLNVVPVQLEESYESVNISSPVNSSNIVRGKYYKQTYRQAWEQMPDFKGWLRGVVGEPTRAYCTYCQKSLHAHRLSLLKHTCTIRHQKAAQIHNSRKNKNQTMEHEVVVIHSSDDMHQEDLENEDDGTIEYSEVTSEIEDEDQEKELNPEDVEDEEDAITFELQVPFEKQHRAEQNYHVGLGKPPISTHVVDTSRGCPVNGLQVSLYKLIDGRWTYINEGVTNMAGRFSNFIEASDFTTGRYKLHYDVDRYFEARKMDSLYPFIEITFDCRGSSESYHIPLLISPFGYSTYRGS